MSWRPWSNSDFSRQGRSHWNSAAGQVDCLYGAASTDLYERDEKWLFEKAFGNLENRRLLKLDLWNEGRNTRILLWAASQGAEVHGIDISDNVIRHARETFRTEGVSARTVMGDVRTLPYADQTFDCIYTMGTIEHLPDPQAAVDEIGRVLKPGGTAVVGTPNKFDPFGRPLVVAVLQALGKYPYAPERSYSFAELENMCENAGLETQGRGGVLFMPGALRMLDLWLHLRDSHLGSLTAAAVKPFAKLTGRLPRLNDYGYLVAVIATRRE